MLINESSMLIEAAKRFYIQTCMVDNAFAQIKSRLSLDFTMFFVIASKMFEELTIIFGNVNCKQEACIEYWSLQQKTRKFSIF